MIHHIAKEGAHRALHTDEIADICADQEVGSHPGIFELHAVGGSEHVTGARVHELSVAILASPGLHALALIGAAIGRRAGTTVQARIVGANVVGQFTVGAQAITWTHTVEATAVSGTTLLGGWTRVGGAIVRAGFTVCANEAPWACALVALAAHNGACSAVQAGTR